MGVVEVGNYLCGVTSILSFVSLKPFSLILSIDVLSTYSRQMIKRRQANVSPCSTPATILKKYVSLSGDRTFTFVFLYSIIMATTVSFGKPWASRICSIFPMWMESKALVKSTNNIVASRFFARTPRIRRIVKICEVVDRFLRKPFGLFLSIVTWSPTERREIRLLLFLRIRINSRKPSKNDR